MAQMETVSQTTSGVSGVPWVTPISDEEKERLSSLTGKGSGLSWLRNVVKDARQLDLYKNGDPDKLLEEMYNNQFDTFQNYYKPMIGSLEEEANSTQLIDQAKERAATLNADSAAAAARMIGRTGAQLTPAQQRQLERSRLDSVAKGESTTVNTARKAQQVIREGATNDLMTTAAAMQSGSVDALTTLSASKEQRDQAYEAANKGFMSNVLGTVGMVGGAIIGGPMGAAVGGGIGNTIGGL